MDYHHRRSGVVVVVVVVVVEVGRKMIKARFTDQDIIKRRVALAIAMGREEWNMMERMTKRRIGDRCSIDFEAGCWKRRGKGEEHLWD